MSSFTQAHCYPKNLGHGGNEEWENDIGSKQ